MFILKQNIYSNHPGTANQSFSFFTLKILTPGVEEDLNDDELVVCSAFLCRAMDIGACVPRSECFLFAFFYSMFILCVNLLYESVCGRDFSLCPSLTHHISALFRRPLFGVHFAFGIGVCVCRSECFFVYMFVLFL